MTHILWASFLVTAGAFAMEVGNLSANLEERYHVLLVRLNALEKENCGLWARSYVEKWADIKADVSTLTEPAQKATIARRLAKEADRIRSSISSRCFLGANATVVPLLNTVTLGCMLPGILDIFPVPRAILASLWSVVVVGNAAYGVYDFRRERTALCNLWAAACEMDTQASTLLPENYDLSHSDSV